MVRAYDRGEIRFATWIGHGRDPEVAYVDDRQLVVGSAELRTSGWFLFDSGTSSNVLGGGHEGLSIQPSCIASPTAWSIGTDRSGSVSTRPRMRVVRRTSCARSPCARRGSARRTERRAPSVSTATSRSNGSHGRTGADRDRCAARSTSTTGMSSRRGWGATARSGSGLLAASGRSDWSWSHRLRARQRRSNSGSPARLRVAELAADLLPVGRARGR